MSLPGKLSLFFLFFTYAYFLPASSPSQHCGWLALSAEIKNFGTQGEGGKSGQDGEQGRDSDSTTVFADGSPLKLNLSGQDGKTGKPGGKGGEAICLSQPQGIQANLQAANGGDGGDGGNGGNGGNGGSLTVYTTNPANLRQIYVVATGGKGGEAGPGSPGGKGCNCSEPFWNVETCTGNPGDANYRCETREFKCRNGRDGREGRRGVDGVAGLPGRLTLINLNKPLETDRPAASLKMAELKEAGATLSKNRWETRSGAMSLFAPGSAIEDQYLMMVERIERSFLLVWNAPQSFSQFAAQNITLSLEDNQEIKVELPSDVWLETTTQQRDNLTEFVVYNAILEKDATQLVSGGLSGNGSKLQLTLTDKANLSNLVGTKFQIKYRITRSDPRFRPVSDYMTKYEGEMPVELISLNGNRFTLNIGQLPIEAENFRSGLGVEIEIAATRTFAGYSAEQKLTVKDVIGPFR